MKLKQVFNFFAAFLLFLGFGMIHTAKTEKVGSVLIGIGAFYLIIVLIVKRKRN